MKVKPRTGECKTQLIVIANKPTVDVGRVAIMSIVDAGRVAIMPTFDVGGKKKDVNRWVVKKKLNFKIEWKVL